MFPSYTCPSTALQNQMPLYGDGYVTFLGETECRTLTFFGYLDLVIRRTSMNLSTNWTKPVDDCPEYIEYEGFDLPSQGIHMRGHGRALWGCFSVAVGHADNVDTRRLTGKTLLGYIAYGLNSHECYF